MAMNKKGQFLFYTLMLSILVIVITLAFASPFKQFISNARGDMNCAGYVNIEDYSNIDYSLVGNYGAPVKTGELIYAKYDVTLTKVIKDSSTTATVAYIYNYDEIQLANSTFIGDEANFNYPLEAGKNYSIVVDNLGLAFLSGYNISWVYPINRENIDYLRSAKGYGLNENGGWSIVSISTQKLDSSSISDWDKGTCYFLDIMFWLIICFGIALGIVVLGAKVIGG
jgi:hypothetical protein